MEGPRLNGNERHLPRSRRPDPRTGRAGGTLDAALDETLDVALDRARNGEEAGFVELYRALQPPLLRYLTVGRNDAPEDLASETWLQVVRDLPGFRGGARDFRAFLFTVARHRAIDAGRARAARPVVHLVAEPTEVHTGDGSVPSAESSALESISTAQALELVASLPPEQAELVMLRVVAGLGVAEVAGIVGKKPGTVRVGVHRALRSLAGTRRARTMTEEEVG